MASSSRSLLTNLLPDLHLASTNGDARGRVWLDIMASSNTTPQVFP